MVKKFRYHTVLSQPNSGGKCSVIIRVSFDNKRIILYSGITLLPKQWSSNKGRVKQGCIVDGYEYNVLNNQLNEQESFIEDYFNNSAYRSTPSSLSDLKERFNYKYKSKAEDRAGEFFFLFDKYIKEKSEDWGKDMIDVVTRLRDRIKKIKPDINFNDMSVATMDEIKKDLATSMFNDAIDKNLSYFKSFITWAKSKNYQIYEEYFGYKPKLPKAKKAVRYLELSEIETLVNLDLSDNEALDRTRDFFLFQCYTALRYVDIAQLKRENITQSSDTGEYFIELVTEKDGDRVKYRLVKKAVEIYLKYADNEYDGGRAFPLISNQKYNGHLKELGKAANLKGEWIDREYRLQEKVDVKVPKCDLTSHTARRTFVVTALNEGADLNMIAIITSHSDFNAMKPYIKANLKGTNKVIDAMDKASALKTKETNITK